ncbi:MAG: type II toxin-antitoxin system HicA family toxin [Xanthobacteraceae bacterium]
MLTNSRDIKRRWEHEGWILERVAGSHHVFTHPVSRETVACLTRRKTWARTCASQLQEGKMEA